MAENRTKPPTASCEGFTRALEKSSGWADYTTALEMYAAIAGLPAVMWGPAIIGFGSRYYQYKTGREGNSPIACFSPRKANMTFYVGKKFKGAEALYAKLGKHKKSIACLYINKLDDVDLGVLREIITRQIDYITSKK